MSKETSGVALYGHQVMTGLMLLVKPSTETEQSPLTLVEGPDAKLPENWIGYQHLYTTSITPSTRLQVTFLSKDYPGLTLDNKLLADKPARSAEEVSAEILPVFETHPDPTVKRYIDTLLAFYSEEEGVEVRTVPWEEELYSLQENNEFAGVVGLFFPIVHFYLPDPDWSVIIRCEPVLEMVKEKE